MVKRIEHPSGLIVYKNENGEFHRDDGPAIIYSDGRKEWYKNGEIHREDGPAAIYPSGRKDWYKNGEIHSFDEWCEKVNVTKEEKIELVLRYG